VLNRALWVIGAGLLVVWTVWWWQSILAGRLIGGPLTWVPAYPFMWLDYLHTHLAVAHLAQGGNPYLEQFGDPNAITYAYPPLMLALFCWTATVQIVPGAIIWTVLSLLMLLVGARSSMVSRKLLGLRELPLPLALGLVLLATPVVFMLERGNSDIIVVFMIALAAMALRGGRGWGQDLLIALCIGVATWTKVYPAVLVVGLLPLRRYRAAAVSAGAIIVMGILPMHWTLDWIHSAQTGVAVNQVAPPSVFTHSIAGHWPFLVRQLGGPEFLQRIPGIAVAAIVLAPLGAWVGWAVFRRRGEALAYPFLLWFAQLATFALPSSYFDYKLIYLPLIALAVWSPRDRTPVHLLMLPFLVYWQPLAVPLASAGLLPWVLWIIKLLALLATGLMLRARAGELAHAASEPAGA
jgi:hypothetical protein